MNVKTWPRPVRYAIVTAIMAFLGFGIFGAIGLVMGYTLALVKNLPNAMNVGIGFFYMSGSIGAVIYALSVYTGSPQQIIRDFIKEETKPCPK
jgi:hypothetical protein